MIFHVTDLDTLSWYYKIESMTVADVIARLLRTEEPNLKMKRGTAWHSVLENPPDSLDTVTKDGFTFEITCDAAIMLPQVREVRAEKTYRLDGMDITLTGGCDGISGLKVTDHKLTFKPNPETYMESYQWRAYLDIFDADVFEYIIYAARDNKDKVVIYDISTMPLYRYPEMQDDLMVGIRSLVGFCQAHIPEICQ
jgi:hypothetical protein